MRTMRTFRAIGAGMVLMTVVGCASSAGDQRSPDEPTLRVGGLTLWPPLGYTTEPLHARDIHTVHVPIFKSHQMRREVEFALTEAVIKAIEQNTPYKVVGKLQADTMLEGDVTYLSKRVLTEDADDDPSQLEVTLTANVRWKDLRTGQQRMAGRVAAEPRPVSASARFIPALGGSLTTATDTAVKDLAERIVEMMEAPW